MEQLYLSLICQKQSMPFLDLTSYPVCSSLREDIIEPMNQLLTKIMTLHFTY